MKNKIFTLLLTLVLVCSAVFSVFAEVDLDNPPDPVEKPHVEDYHDNDKIKDYNEKATEYNNKVEEYNKAVDAEYENAVQSVDEFDTNLLRSLISLNLNKLVPPN